MSEQEISRRHDKSRFNKRPSKNSLSRHADITSILFPFKACWRAVIQKNHNELLLGSFSHHGCRRWCTDGPHAVSFGRGCSADLREQNSDNRLETYGDIVSSAVGYVFRFLMFLLIYVAWSLRLGLRHSYTRSTSRLAWTSRQRTPLH